MAEQSTKFFGKLGLEVIFAGVVVIVLLWVFTSQGALEELAVNQQLGHFYKFRSQVASVCERVKVNPSELQVSKKEFIVLYPYYDIRFYNKTSGMPDEVKKACGYGDKCGCIVKAAQRGGETDLDGVYSCFNMQELGCNNELWIAKKTTDNERQLRNYTNGYWEDLPKTCKSEGVVKWDGTGFFYHKLSDDCIERVKRV